MRRAYTLDELIRTLVLISLALAPLVRPLRDRPVSWSGSNLSQRIEATRGYAIGSVEAKKFDSRTHASDPDVAYDFSYKNSSVHKTPRSSAKWTSLLKEFQP